MRPRGPAGSFQCHPSWACRRDNVEERIGDEGHRFHGAQSDQLLMAQLERERVEQPMKLLRVHKVEFGVEEELAESLSGKTGLLNQPLDGDPVCASSSRKPSTATGWSS